MVQGWWIVLWFTEIDAMELVGCDTFRCPCCGDGLMAIGKFMITSTGSFSGAGWRVEF